METRLEEALLRLREVHDRLEYVTDADFGAMDEAVSNVAAAWSKRPEPQGAEVELSAEAAISLAAHGIVQLSEAQAEVARLRTLLNRARVVLPSNVTVSGVDSTEVKVEIDQALAQPSEGEAGS